MGELSLTRKPFFLFLDKTTGEPLSRASVTDLENIVVIRAGISFTLKIPFFLNML